MADDLIMPTFGPLADLFRRADCRSMPSVTIAFEHPADRECVRRTLMSEPWMAYHLHNGPVVNNLAGYEFQIDGVRYKLVTVPR